MSVRPLGIEEMMSMPDGAHAVYIHGWDCLTQGAVLTRKHDTFDDGDSVAFWYGVGDDKEYEFFEAGEVGVVEPELQINCGRVASDFNAHMELFQPEVEVGNPKVGAASKKYSLRYLPLSANIEANRALENGADKYGLCNWRDTNVKASVYIDAALRHIFQWQEGQEEASDSTVHNLGHAMASLAIIIDAQAQGVLIDDRPTASKDTDNLLLRG